MLLLLKTQEFSVRDKSNEINKKNPYNVNFEV